MSLRRGREKVEKVIFMNVPLNFIKTYSKVWGEVMNVQEGVKLVVDKLKLKIKKREEKPGPQGIVKST